MLFLKQRFLIVLMIDFCDFEKDVDLKNFCTIRIGGKAKYLFVAKSTRDLIQCCKFCLNNNLKFKLIGLGANLIFSDNGFDGVIIVNKTNKFKVKGKNISCNSGFLISELLQTAKNNSLSGIENLAGIPSTAGGACVGNLGAFECNFGDFVEWVEVLDLSTFKRKKLKHDECKFGYRSSIFKGNNFIILNVCVLLSLGEKNQIAEKMKQAVEKKCSSQPMNKLTAGSMFKRCEIMPAKIIDELGLKGLRIGDAMVSKKHAGFVENIGNASEKDVKQLNKIIKEKVFLSSGVMIEEEVEFVE